MLIKHEIEVLNVVFLWVGLCIQVGPPWSGICCYEKGDLACDRQGLEDEGERHTQAFPIHVLVKLMRGTDLDATLGLLSRICLEGSGHYTLTTAPCPAILKA